MGLTAQAGSGMLRATLFRSIEACLMTTIKHPLEPLTADEVQLAVSLLKDNRKVTPTTRFVSVSLKEPPKDFVHTFTGKEPREATVTIREGTLQVQDGHQGVADLRVTADSEAWLGFLAKERSLLWALLRRKIRVKGSPRLLDAFGKCFPS